MTLDVELTRAPEQISPNLVNLKADPQAKIKSVKLSPSVWENDDFRDLTDEEMNQVVFEEPQIRLGSHEGTVTHQAPNGKHFTVQDLIQAIEITEKETRAKTEWFGGVDVHHVFYEGLHWSGAEESWRIMWGS